MSTATKVVSSESTIPYASLREWRDIILLLRKHGAKITGGAKNDINDCARPLVAGEFRSDAHAQPICSEIKNSW